MKADYQDTHRIVVLQIFENRLVPIDLKKWCAKVKIDA